MPEEKQTDDIEKVQSIEARKDALIDDLLRQKAEAVKAFDEKLAARLSGEGWRGQVEKKPR